MEDIIMIKKDYLKPAMRVLKMQHRHNLLLNSVETQGLGERSLKYDKDGGDQRDAW